MRLTRGLVEVYTGNGKGKTTASFGLALRAAGWGMHVYILQFMKLGTYGENRGVNNLGELIRLEYVGMPYFIVWEDEYRKGNNGRVANVKVCPRGQPPPEYRNLAQEAFRKAEEEMLSCRWDVVILDEVNVAIYYGLVDEDQVIKMIDEKPPNTELVMTGRKMPERIMERADLVTEMVEVKHPFRAGVPARRGIDF
ncbi:cob(I)alamin adenolsyltransferase/cobinamide ATP-dependent adenolsyltransferase [Thermogymnomonas acidicola]|uniref:Cob(I)alamin adenolsyltransferase/cobinamide ATP-dependent adenolsyltransferase n=1 Tax=Thermogymnomonas acidicola TaxID=399579 RepID=A0AA37BR53_9ARCH|nr:cob(I)yrinic acid a,c-diamide adenosyltransferase [Thermogymnomonas acidicola]GGM73343.1 cob(I)alamin adenolsyltransferase/cobinamide ATP-dependent adenolsyltransferase [Thermogymnomonas acidicola]